jgi:CRP/FNR family transcriptional regulator, cyclic AMP receptor protein
MLPMIKVKADTVIFKEGDYNWTMFVVLEGKVKIYVERNEEEIELSVIDKYDFFGEMALYRQRPRSASAKVIEDARLVVIKTRAQLEQFIQENPSFAGKMMVIMGNRLANSNDLLLEQMGVNAPKEDQKIEKPEFAKDSHVRIVKNG